MAKMVAKRITVAVLVAIFLVEFARNDAEKEVIEENSGILTRQQIIDLLGSSVR